MKGVIQMTMGSIEVSLKPKYEYADKMEITSVCVKYDLHDLSTSILEVKAVQGKYRESGRFEAFGGERVILNTPIANLEKALKGASETIDVSEGEDQPDPLITKKQGDSLIKQLKGLESNVKPIRNLIQAFIRLGIPVDLPDEAASKKLR